MHLFDRYRNNAGEFDREFEIFHQHGCACFAWSLPKPMVRQAFLTLCKAYQAKGVAITLRDIRGFVLGTQGRSVKGPVSKQCPSDYNWPLPPDDSWKMIVCHYPDSLCDLDFVNRTTRRFWSEDHGFLQLPSYDPEQMGYQWFRLMGIPVLEMQPALELLVERKRIHLSAVR